MRFALVHPNWRFDGSVYFGCREPHLPLELAYAKACLEQKGHEAILVDGHMERLGPVETNDRIRDFKPDFTVLETAPTYLFWRCTQPELSIPLQLARVIRKYAGTLVIVGPHASATPAAAVHKLQADAALLGEFEDSLSLLCDRPGALPYFFDAANPGLFVPGSAVPHEADIRLLPPLNWPGKTIAAHKHHHHRFDTPVPEGPAAEIEASRGCPFKCLFCAKENFRNSYRKRPLEKVLAEINNLASKGAAYLYFIDEIFLPDKALLDALSQTGLKFGIQTRIDLWSEGQLEALGKAGCVSIEAGVESITETGRMSLGKRCRASGEQIFALLTAAKRHVPFVQANLVKSKDDHPEAVDSWRRELLRHGVWANDPVPVFPYPGSPAYKKLWGAPDDWAWERAHGHYLCISQREGLSEIQEKYPVGLEKLEAGR